MFCVVNMEEQLILTVSYFPILYDHSQNNYRHINKKAAAWETVGARFVGFL